MNVQPTPDRPPQANLPEVFHDTFGYCVLTVLGQFLYASEKLAGMLLYESGEALIAASPNAPFRTQTFRSALMDHYLDEGRIADVESHWIRRDGSQMLVRLNGRLFVAESGEPAFELIVQDASGREDDRHLSPQEATTIVGGLANGVVHDLKGLLSIIRGGAALLSSELGDDSAARRYLEEIEVASACAGTLVKRFLGTPTSLHDEVASTDLNEVLSASEHALAKLLGSGLHLETQLCDTPLPVAVSREKVDQILLNLLFNARDATPPGGQVRVEIRRAGGTHGGGANGWILEGAMLSVTDDGAGMGGKTRDQIFEPFFTTKSASGSTGLGLSIVADIVKDAGGTIDVTTQLGKGSTFSVWLPLAGKLAPTKSDSKALPSELSKGTVLVVDDEEGTMLFISRVLAREGYTVLSARHGLEALEILETVPKVDIVVTDLVMPKMGGMELAATLDSRGSRIPVLFMSGDPGALEDLAAAPERATSSVVLPKPFGPDELRRGLGRLLECEVTRQAG